MTATRAAQAGNYRDAAAYSVAEAAHYLRLPTATLRSWVVGREYPKAQGAGKFSPLVRAAQLQPAVLSFNNLIEAHVLRSLRTHHGVSVKALRSAISYAQERLGLDKLLLSPELRTDAGRIFVERYGELIEISASGQLAMRKMLEEHLLRVEWDEAKFPVRLYPFLSASSPSEQRAIAIDPRIAFGRPVVVGRNISTAVIAERLDAGESVAALASDYDLKASEIEQAALYERAA